MDLLKSTPGKCFAFGLLYFPEGLIEALAIVIVPLYMASLGFDASIVGLVVGLSTIPWVVKFFWGAAADYYASKGRRFFVLFGGILGAIMSILLYFISPSIIFIFTTLLFLARAGIAILDVATDALSIISTAVNERGKVTGSMFFGQLFGYAVGSLALTKMSETISFPITFLSVGLLVLFIMSVLFFIKERKKKDGGISFKDLKKAFQNKSMRYVIPLALIIDIPGGLVLGMSTYYMNIYLSVPVATVGMIVLLYGIANAIGAYTCGSVSDKIGRLPSIFIFLIPAAIFAGLLSIANSQTLFQIIFPIFGFFVGGLIAVICALFMDVTTRKVAATQYAILTSLANFGIFIGETPSGFLLQGMGPKTFFLTAALLYIPSMLLTYIVLRKLKPIKEETQPIPKPISAK